jgi:hypothetical protein
MGLVNRGTITHPEKQAQPSPQAGVAEAPSAGAVASAAPEAAETPHPSESKPKKGRRFSIFRKPAEARPEGETAKEAAEAQPAWQLKGTTTVMFWNGVMGLGRGAIQLADKTIHAKKPYDTSNMEFTKSEEAMIEETMPGITTRILKWFGVKSEASAEAFVHGLVILRIFGRIFVGVGAHFFDEMREKGKEKRAKIEAAKLSAKPIVSGQPPVEPQEEQNEPNTQ